MFFFFKQKTAYEIVPCDWSSDMCSSDLVLPAEWNPVAVGNLQKELGSFRNWTLCGGYSVDQWAGRNTRPHGDIDVGVFRSELRECLGAIGRGRVYLCSPTGTHTAWEGGDVHESIHDIWITNATGKYWTLQIMVFDDDGDRVIGRASCRERVYGTV